MCGIGGFSLSPASKISPRKLAHALLSEMESRGSMASGYAWETDKSSGVFKKDVRGSKLSLWHMPWKTKNAILHTRLATHGSVLNNNNNHPVLSPDNSIALVHNGVIYNHNTIRGELPMYQLPEVDTSVIPAIVQHHGPEKFSMLDGDAAVAWLDENDRGKIKLARIEHSPLWIAQGNDGSFFFASTEHILKTALDNCKIQVDWIHSVEERKFLTVSQGVITEFGNVPEIDPAYEMAVSTYSYDKYRHMTAGGTGQPRYTLIDNPNTDFYGDLDEVCPSNEDLARWDVKTFEQFIVCFDKIDNFYYDSNYVCLGDGEDMRELFEDYSYFLWQYENNQVKRSEYSSEYAMWTKMDELWD